MRKIDELKNDLDLGDYGEYLNDYRNSSEYICDAITEIADNHTSIYYADIMRFISENPDSLADVVAEGLYDPSHNYDLYEHGQAAEFMTIENNLYKNLPDSIMLTALDYIEYDADKEGLYIMNDNGEIPDELADLIRKWADDADTNDYMCTIIESIKEWLEENKED